MNRKLQLLYLIEQYCGGKYDAQAFSSFMTKIYYIEKDDSLSEKEKEILAPLSNCAKYFSPYTKEHEEYNGFTTEEAVKKQAAETYSELLKYYKKESFEDWINGFLDENLCDDYRFI